MPWPVNLNDRKVCAFSGAGVSLAVFSRLWKLEDHRRDAGATKTGETYSQVAQAAVRGNMVVSEMKRFP
jgi:hypothetical protein